MKYRKKPVLTEATQWFMNGDHPQDESTPIDNPDGPQRVTEGKVVQYFRSLNIPGEVDSVPFAERHARAWITRRVERRRDRLPW